MTSSSEWNAIADACEAAEGPDRKIDARMAAALGTPATSFFTGSLDVIVQVMVWGFPGHAIRADLASFENDGRCLARLYKPARNGSFDEVARGFSTTPALALCAAFCRAMAVKAENEANEAAE